MTTLLEAVREARSGRAHTIRCPAHEDRSPSLSVRPGKKAGAVLIKCFAGCSPQAVLAAGGLGWTDVCPPHNNRLVPPGPCRIAKASKPRSDSEDDQKRAEKRRAWPPFVRPTTTDLKTIATLRGLGVAGLELAVARGVLWMVAEHHGHRCWCITDDARITAQVRRLDGQLFETSKDKPKALTLAGGMSSWPVGVAALGANHRAVIMCEGGPDLLTAFHFIVCEGREADAGAVAMLGASASIQEDTLTRFAGRRVRIVEHDDDKGAEAASKWAAQLRDHASHVDGLKLDGLRQFDGKPIKDLNDLARIDADDFEAHRILWSITP